MILFAVKHCFNGVIIGMPPATLASNMKSTSCFSAASNISLPNCAKTSLFAVTTCLPFSIAFNIYSRAGCIPPNNSTTISMLSSFKISSILSVKTTSPLKSRFLFKLRTKTLLTSISLPIFALIS